MGKFCVDQVIYDVIVYRWVYPGQALIVAAVLAFVPYLMIRGPATRIARRFMPRQNGSRERAEQVGAADVSRRGQHSGPRHESR